MKVFKFYCGESHYAFAAQTKELAIAQFIEETGDLYTVCEEIPENEWDKKFITVCEDNDLDKAKWNMSIREAITGTEPQLVFTNNPSSMN